MRRRRRTPPPQGLKQVWLISYGDTITLLLTFFVLLLSMSSLDRSYVADIGRVARAAGEAAFKPSGQSPERIRRAARELSGPQAEAMAADKLSELLFPREVLPPGIDRATLEENLRLLARPEGLAVVLTEGLVFAPGRAELTPEAGALLAQVALLLRQMRAAVNIAGFSDPSQPRQGDNYVLAGERAAAVLGFFLREGLSPERFSISAYGPNLPLADNAAEAGRAANRRVEIVIKTERPLGSYS